jgi:hypothetical protein
MTDETNAQSDPGSDGEPGREWEPGGSRSAQGREWLAQLQQMIDKVAAEAAPVARDIAAKAAELAAVAGEKAGPIAKRAAEVTEDVGSRVAERSRRFADDMRHHGAEAGGPPPETPADASAAEEAKPKDEAPPA